LRLLGTLLVPLKYVTYKWLLYYFHFLKGESKSDSPGLLVYLACFN
jgi:hypothetical protein